MFKPKRPATAQVAPRELVLSSPKQALLAEIMADAGTHKGAMCKQPIRTNNGGFLLICQWPEVSSMPTWTLYEGEQGNAVLWAYELESTEMIETQLTMTCEPQQEAADLSKAPPPLPAEAFDEHHQYRLGKDKEELGRSTEDWLAGGGGAAAPSKTFEQLDAYGQPIELDPYGNPIEPLPPQPVAPAQQYGNQPDPYGAPVDPYGQPIDPYAQPVDPYGQPPQQQGWGNQPPQQPWGNQPPQQMPYGQPPQQMPYGQPPQQMPYGQPPQPAPYGQPPQQYGQQPYGVPQPPYGAPIDPYAQPPQPAPYDPYAPQQAPYDPYAQQQQGGVNPWNQQAAPSPFNPGAVAPAGAPVDKVAVKMLVQYIEKHPRTIISEMLVSDVLPNFCADAAMRLQEMVCTGKLDDKMALQVLILSAEKGGKLDDSMVNEVKERARSEGGGVETQELLATAQLFEPNPETLEAAKQCVRLIAEGKLRQDKAIITLHYIQRAKAKLADAFADLDIDCKI